MDVKEIVRVLNLYNYSDCSIRLLIEDILMCGDFICKCNKCFIPILSQHKTLTKKCK